MQPMSSKSELIFQASRSGRTKELSNAICTMDRKHIQADSVRGSTYDLQIGTYENQSSRWTSALAVITSSVLRS